MKTRSRFVSSVANRGKYFFSLLCVAAITSGLSSCDEPDQLGLGLLPTTAQLPVLATDTTTVVSYTVEGDSLATNKNFLAYLLGSYTDPVFGRTDASVYAQLGLSFSPSFGDSTETLTADSLVLTLEYFGSFYGNKNTPLKVTVYRLTEDMSVDSIYYTNRSFATGSQPIGSGTFIPQPTDSVKVYDKNTAPHVRIKMSSQLAAELLALNNTDTFANTANWLSYFKGIYIKTEPVNAVNEGSVCQFFLSGIQSALWLYYHTSTAGEDSLKYFFPFNAARINHFDHSYASSDAGRQLQDSTFNDSITYIQSMAGVWTKIQFPHFSQIESQGPVVLNAAQLIVPVQYASTEVYLPPARLNLLAGTSDGGTESLIDYTNEALYFGGNYNALDKTYTFNITRHLQAILTGNKEDHGFYLTVPYIVSSNGFILNQPGRVIVSSGKNSLRPVQLKITYSKVD